MFVVGGATDGHPGDTKEALFHFTVARTPILVPLPRPISVGSWADSEVDPHGQRKRGAGDAKPSWRASHQVLGSPAIHMIACIRVRLLRSATCCSWWRGLTLFPRMPYIARYPWTSTCMRMCISIDLLFHCLTRRWSRKRGGGADGTKVCVCARWRRCRYGRGCTCVCETCVRACACVCVCAKCVWYTTSVCVQRQAVGRMLKVPGLIPTSCETAEPMASAHGAAQTGPRCIPPLLGRRWHMPSVILGASATVPSGRRQLLAAQPLKDGRPPSRPSLWRSAVSAVTRQKDKMSAQW